MNTRTTTYWTVAWSREPTDLGKTVTSRGKESVPLSPGARQAVREASPRGIRLVQRLGNDLLLIRGPRSLPATPDGDAARWGLIGHSEAIQRVLRRIRRVAPGDEHVLVTGQTGVGKELVSQALHRASSRSEGRFAAFNAASVPFTLFASELFGNARHYPNHGQPAREGLVGVATGGTLFIDEIGELSPGCQAALLRLMDDAGQYLRLGDPTPRRADIRIVAATNRDPLTALRPDLLARFGARLSVPPLSERREDIPLLVAALLPSCGGDWLPAPPWPSIDLMEMLVRARHPLNVRGLGTALRHAALEAETPLLEATKEVAGIVGAQPRRLARPSSLERPAVLTALDETEWHRTSAAEALGLGTRFSLQRLMKKLDIVEARDRRG